MTNDRRPLICRREIKNVFTDKNENKRSKQERDHLGSQCKVMCYEARCLVCSAPNIKRVSLRATIGSVAISITLTSVLSHQGRGRIRYRNIHYRRLPRRRVHPNPVEGLLAMTTFQAIYKNVS